jgi:hypothetical protein
MTYRPSRQYSDLRKSVFQGNVLSNSTGPLNTNQYPCIIPYHSYGSIPGIHPNPPYFYPADVSSQNSMSRYQYLKTTSPLNTNFITSKTKYNAPMSSSERTTQKRANAVGKFGYKVGLPNDALLSNKSYFATDVSVATKRVRNQGCTAPKKCSSIYNTTLRNPKICSYGELVRQTY